MKTLKALVILGGLFIASCQSDFSTTSHEQPPSPFTAQKFMPINFEASINAGLIEEEDINSIMRSGTYALEPLLALLFSEEQEKTSLEEFYAASLDILSDDHAPGVRIFLEQQVSMKALDHARDFNKPMKPEHAAYFVDLLLKNENANAHLIAYALSSIGDYWPDDRITSSATQAADFAEAWLSPMQGLHKITPIDEHEEENAHVVGLGGAQANQMQSLEIAIEQLREM